MIDVLGNVINVGDIVVCALGANHNNNNSALVPCRVTKVTDTYCMIVDANDIERYGRKNSLGVSYKHRRKHSHQIAKINNYVNKTLAKN